MKFGRLIVGSYVTYAPNTRVPATKHSEALGTKLFEKALRPIYSPTGVDRVDLSYLPEPIISLSSSLSRNNFMIVYVSNSLLKYLPNYLGGYR